MWGRSSLLPRTRSAARRRKEGRKEEGIPPAEAAHHDVSADHPEAARKADSRERQVVSDDAVRMVFAIVVDTKLHFLGPLENASMEFPLVFAELLSCGPGPGSTSAAPGIFKALEEGEHNS